MNIVNPELFGRDPKILKAVQFAKNVSVTKAPVLVTGEAGTGKRTLSMFIHQNSSRRDQSFCVVDCSEDSTKVESSILGHRHPETGRFIKGALEANNKGTVVFANIDSLEEDLQKKLFKIFNELEDYDIDIRIMATTTKNLSKLVGSSRFYRALYIYISGTQIQLTPLRERQGDVQYLSKEFLQIAASENQIDLPSMPEEAMNKLMSHYWTHNLSELSSVMSASLENINEGILAADGLAIGDKKAVSSFANDSEDGIRLMSLKEAEKLLIRKALIHTSENRTQAAKILGVSIRTLRNKINEYRSEGSTYFVNLR